MRTGGSLDMMSPMLRRDYLSELIVSHSSLFDNSYLGLVSAIQRSHPGIRQWLGREERASRKTFRGSMF